MGSSPNREFPLMTKLRPAVSALFAVLLTSTALAAGGTTATPAPAPTPKVTIVKPKAPAATVTAPIVKKTTTAVAKKAAPVALAITDDWAKTFGDLGPAYIAAVTLAKADKYEEAIKAMQALNKPDDPRVNNWIGYSLRKLGKVDEAMPYYDKALKAAPNFTPAHEYLGEAYIQMKDAAKAKEQLAQIEKLCGNKACEEYQDLSKALKLAKL
jgi:tetratricopeptide (TPR) repeat protein